MRFLLQMFVSVLLSGIAGELSAAGPAQHPERFADFGGTPDLLLSGDIQMSPDELSALFEQLDSDSLRDRIAAAAEIRQNAVGAETIYRHALWQAGNVGHRELKDVLQRASGRAGEPGGIAGALVQMDNRDEAVNRTTRIVVMLVALHALDTMTGYKVLLDFSGRYAGAFRGLIGDMMVHAGLKALPALIYGRGSKNRELHMFSVAWIREMGNPLLSQQIQGIRNSRRLAQLLEAYASVNELDAIDVTLSLANHESNIVRKAARACLNVYGQNAKWSIHREYENVFGDEPEAGDYGEWAAEIYKVWDAQRDSKTIALSKKGSAAASSGRFDEMDATYRELLSISPLNPHRPEIARDYLSYAASLESKGAHRKAILATRMARRLSDDTTDTFKEATARLSWLHSEALRHGGALDVAAYQKLQQTPALKSDAARWATYGQGTDKAGAVRWRAVILVSLMIFLCALLLYWRGAVRR
ncbi:MAG: hypothetical protein JXX14_20460 [Deltaproteobacteria bacterium]|nr:hypothetical protein [Deltaproteobacteria bacterium]